MSFTSIAPLYPSLDAQIRVNQYIRQYENLPDEKLKTIISECLKKYDGVEIPRMFIADLPQEWYQAKAAANILREKHGDDILEELGIPKPKGFFGTLIEMLKHRSTENKTH